MSISNEIREYASEYNRSYVFNYGELRAFAARLDREMVELPKDRDGVPIHIGDTVYLDDGRKAKECWHMAKRLMVRKVAEDGKD